MNKCQYNMCKVVEKQTSSLKYVLYLYKSVVTGSMFIRLRVDSHNLYLIT